MDHVIYNSESDKNKEKEISKIKKIQRTLKCVAFTLH